jgi:protein-S-isoprenylcysteine O-methyltransferase Ste14
MGFEQKTGFMKRIYSNSRIAWILQSVTFLALIAICLFLTSGRLDWLMAWIYFGVSIVFAIFSGLVMHHNHPDLMAERSTIKKDIKKWDRLLLGILSRGPLIVPAVAGLDMRYVWTPANSYELQISALIIGVAGHALSLWALSSNKFFSAVVRIQTDRGHSVASEGPYLFIRHPGYLGMILLLASAPVMLDSSWAFIPATITIAAIIVRTSLEDATLQKELDGYASYTQQVRYLLLPRIW